MNTLREEQAPLTISQLSLALKHHIEKNFECVYVQGEISGCKYHSSGHIYFALKDTNAVLDAVCWRSVKLSLMLSDGMSVLCQGRLTTYGARSKYQLVIEHIQQMGQGDMLRLIQQLKEKLLQEGLFAPERKKQLPPFPQLIGLITSPTGAVIQDMCARFQERLPCHFLLYPVSVQGKNTVPDILKALAYFHQCVPRPDILIIARGGGSVEDLWPFHDETLIRAVVASDIPIVSAIGHETDTTLLDYAADVRALTPTAAAEMVLPSCAYLRIRLQECIHNMAHHLTYLCNLRDGRVDALHKRLLFFRTLTESFDQKIDYLCENLWHHVQHLMRALEHRVFSMDQKLKAYPIDASMISQINTWHHLIAHSFKSLLEQKKIFLTSCERLLDHLSYHAILKKGFALVLDENRHTITSRANVIKKQRIKLCFHDGEASVSVEKS